MSRQVGKQHAANQWTEQAEKDGKKFLRTNDIDSNKELRGKPFNWVEYHFKLFGEYPK